MDPSAFSKPVARANGDPARDGRLPPNAEPSSQGKFAADPADLVARALAILAEDSFTNDVTRFPSSVGASAEPGTPSVGLPLERRVLSDGTECSLPIRYFDVQCLVATFLAELGRAAELLRDTGLKAVSQEDGKAVVALYCIEYRKTDIGPYNEVGLAVLALAPGDPIPAHYVVDLPVTTAVANRAGREIWGYNKFVAGIDVKSDGKKFSMFLRDSEKEMIGALEGDRGASVPAPAADIVTFTLLRGRLIRTIIQVLTPFQASSGDGLVFRIGTSRHPMTSRLRTLGLDGARPVVVQYADPFQALLFPGRAL
jgi:hypothetical protein